ncbi:putative ATPase [Asanoa ferruginea]|uniref:Putative ATPase n=1 Tax=Asanoa ferruginea TaxID=53367 RepID=A0A3D9Z9Y5_9ACTN|nr:DUF4062 domain-containing protein [Asanoa ferruginea]REF94151.1 putative ATPase [Asanoa ferruginea]GIF52621.1 hypothetical protein Afe04nite_71600 [Asanoa ferruginea]
MSVILTPDQRVRVFVSSSMTELTEERQAVREAIGQVRLLPVMFDQGARPHAPRDVYRAYLEQSQIFIGVYGESYGWVAPGEEISGLEDEFRMAVLLPRLIYVKDADHRDPRLVAMLDGIEHAADVSFRRFRTSAELRDQVGQDLALLLSERFERTREPQAELVTTSLPAARTPLVGREDDLAALQTMLVEDAVPLVTLIGTGGIGKTRLAAATAQRLAHFFADGARFVDLSSVTSPALVGEALARGLGVRTSGGVPAEVDVSSWLRTKRMLLVVDNFEQVAEAGPVIGEILRTAPGVTALVTSRAPLRLADERVYVVPGLSLPPELAGPHSDPVVIQAGSEAVRLFVDTARASSPRFALTADNVGAVIEITRRLYGLPLAIMLAAAKVRVLPPDAIVEHLGDQLGLLTGGARDLPDRQRTMRDTIAWSYHLLSADERALFDRLGVFAGGWDLEALAVITGPGGDLLSMLDALVGSTLVCLDTLPDGQPRFSMLETIRHFALEQLASGDEWAAVHDTHAAYYGALARAAEPKLNLVSGAPWLHRLEREHGNLTAALDWFIEREDPASALGLLWPTWTFWWRRGHVDEAGRYLARILDRRRLLGPPDLGLALLAAGGNASVSGQLEEAEDDLQQALPLLGETGQEAAVSIAVGMIGHFAAKRGDWERADHYLTEAADRAAGLGENWQVSLAHSRLALIAVDNGQHDQARSHAQIALNLSDAGQEQFTAVVAHYAWAFCAIAQDYHVDARQHLVEGLSLAAAAGDEAALGTFLGAVADIDSRHGDLSRSVRLRAAASALRTPSNEMWMQAFVTPWRPIGLDPPAARNQLGEDGYAAAWQAGEMLGTEKAVAEATTA